MMSLVAEMSRCQRVAFLLAVVSALPLVLGGARWSRADGDRVSGIGAVQTMRQVASRPSAAPGEATAPQDLSAKWREVRRAIASETDTLARCQVRHCQDVAARRFLAIAALAHAQPGRARLGVANRAINLAVRPMSDLVQYGVDDRWATPLETLARGAGDCEDYAIAKYAVLRAAGVDEDDLRLIVVRDTKQREDHAVVAARLEGRWLVLDNRRMRMLELNEIPDYVPLFALGADGFEPMEGYAMRAPTDGRTGALPRRR
jgi:predicted transglutaminase-like cysteine proteinase